MNKPMQLIEVPITERESVRDLLRYRDAGPSLAGPAVAVGRLCALIPGTGPLVDFPHNESAQPVPARTTVGLSDVYAGCPVVLAFEDGDVTRPIILGVLQDENCLSISNQTTSGAQPRGDEEADRLLITANREITLRCGKASITLTKAGKLLIEGEYVVSRSAGVNKIRGGSVQIN